jgi:S1-C subfamily serine protease
VEEGGPGDAAGLERGDLLVAAGGRALGGVDDLFDALAASDGALELVALRGTEERTVVARFN